MVLVILHFLPHGVRALVVRRSTRTARVREDVTSSTYQRTTMQHLPDNVISSRRGIMCTHPEPAYVNCQIRHPLGKSEAAQRQCVIIPLYPSMTDAKIDSVASALRAACKHFAAA